MCLSNDIKIILKKSKIKLNKECKEKCKAENKIKMKNSKVPGKCKVINA